MKYSVTLFFSLIYFFMGCTFAQDFWNGPSSVGGTVISVAVDTTGTLFASTDIGMSMSIDNGATWNSIPYFSNRFVSQIEVLSNNNIFADQYYKSTDNGANWDSISTYPSIAGFSNVYGGIESVTRYNEYNNLFGYDISGLVKSTDFGATWQNITYGSLGKGIYSLGENQDGSVLVGSDSGYVYYLAANSTSWKTIPISATKKIIHTVSFLSNGWFIAGTVDQTAGDGLFISTDQGATWSHQSLQGNAVLSFLPLSNGIVYAGTFSNGVYKSTDNGMNWTQLTPIFPAYGLTLSKTGIIYAAGYSGVYSSKQSVTAVDNSRSNIPTDFNLSQNYPNPFNPSTRIQFSIPQRNFVTLKIYDELGREVTTLVSKELSAGTYNFTWNADRLTSGVYFYRLFAGSFVMTKKLMLLK